MRRASIAVVVAAMALGSVGAAHSSPFARRVSVRTYLRTLCTSVSLLGDSLSEAERSLQSAINASADVPALRERVAEHFNRAATLVDSARAKLAKQIPKIRGGKKHAAALQESFHGVTSNFVDAEARVRGLILEEPEFFFPGLLSILQDTYTTPGAVAEIHHMIDRRFDTPKLNRAVLGEPACVAVFGGGGLTA